MAPADSCQHLALLILVHLMAKHVLSLLQVCANRFVRHATLSAIAPDSSPREETRMKTD